MAILATGLVAPQAFAAGTQDVLSIVTGIQTAISDPSHGLQAIQNNVNTRATQTSVNTLQTTDSAIKAKTDNLPSEPASNTAITNAIGTINSHTDSAVASVPPGMTQAQFQTLKCQSEPRPYGNYTNCDLEDVRFIEASLVHADLSGAKLNDAILQGSLLPNANLSGADLTLTNFGGASLAYANLNGTNLSNTIFQNADLTGVTYAGCTGKPVGTPLYGTLPTC
jgi:uncharacterized protein YjbI with pentapeptide repeats